MEILFVHGAGGWVDDQPLAEALRTHTGLPVSMPRFPDEDMSSATWRRGLADALAALGPDTLLVGHSFGASIALQHVAFHPRTVRGLALLAMPSWAPDGWEHAEYALPADTTVSPDVPTWLHHCLDDEEVPVAHLDQHVTRLPHALVRRHDTGGHQLDGRMDAVAEDLA